jgi:hypothetical protein
MMMPSPDPLCALALGLTIMLAFSADRSPLADGISIPAWLPVAVLAAFAIGSSVLGITHAESFALAFAES